MGMPQNQGTLNNQPTRQDNMQGQQMNNSGSNTGTSGSMGATSGGSSNNMNRRRLSARCKPTATECAQLR